MVEGAFLGQLNRCQSTRRWWHMWRPGSTRRSVPLRVTHLRPVARCRKPRAYEPQSTARVVWIPFTLFTDAFLLCEEVLARRLAWVCSLLIRSLHAVTKNATVLMFSWMHTWVKWCSG